MCGGGSGGGGTRIIYMPSPVPEPPPQTAKQASGGVSSEQTTGPTDNGPNQGAGGIEGAGGTLLTRKKTLLGQ